MKPRVFLAHRQGFAWFTSPHLSFIKLRKSRRAGARRCRKLSGVISNASAATVSLTPKMRRGRWSSVARDQGKEAFQKYRTASPWSQQVGVRISTFGIGELLRRPQSTFEDLK